MKLAHLLERRIAAVFGDEEAVMAAMHSVRSPSEISELRGTLILPQSVLNCDWTQVSSPVPVGDVLSLCRLSPCPLSFQVNGGPISAQMKDETADNGRWKQ